MGLFSRTRDINVERIDELVSQAPDRLRILRLIIKDVEGAVMETRSQEAMMLRQARQLQRETAEAERLQDDLTENARHALAADREDLARRALNRKYDSIGKLEGLRQRAAALHAEAAAIAVEVARLEDVLSAVKDR
jgi:phage shock protein A